MKRSYIKKKRKLKLTWNVLQHLSLWNIDLLEGFANFILPKRDKIIEGVNIFRRSNIKNFVYCSWIIHTSNCVSPNVFFLVEYCYQQKINNVSKKNKNKNKKRTLNQKKKKPFVFFFYYYFLKVKCIETTFSSQISLFVIYLFTNVSKIQAKSWN